MNTQRKEARDSFLEREGLNCISIKEDCIAPYFTWRGCDSCKTRLGIEVYDCIGYHPETKEVVEGFEVCGDCINFFYNGETAQ